MIGRSDSRGDGRELAALVDDIRVQLLNCSVSGCLLASNKPVMEGTVATLQVSLSGRTFTDVVKVVRCERLDRGAGLYYLGARFLSITPAYTGSLRHAMRDDARELAARQESDARSSADKDKAGERKPEGDQESLIEEKRGKDRISNVFDARRR